MNCTRCGAELPAIAQVCPRCGMPRQQMMPIASSVPLASPSSPQQMMPVVPPMSVVPPPPVVTQYMSPYLPAGTPTWPTVAAPQHQMPLSTTPAVSAPGTFAQGHVKSERAGRSAFSARNILTGIVFLVVVALLGTGITYGTLYLNGSIQAHAPLTSISTSQLPTPQATAGTSTGTTPTPGATGNLPTPTSFVSMSSSNQKLLSILIKYPQGWLEETNTPQSDGSVAVDFRPQQQLGIVMFVGRFSASSGTTSDINQGQIQGLSSVSGISNLQTVQPATPQQTIGGSKWDEADATFTNSNSDVFHVVSVTVKHGNYFYNILYSSPNVYYSEAIQKYIQPMLDSFKFLA